MNTTPPGWYQAEGDPPGTQRYWDGTSWSDTPVPSSGAASPQPPNTPQDAVASSPGPPSQPAQAAAQYQAPLRSFEPVEVVDRSPLGWFMHVLRENFSNFEGRARRSEYWWFTLINAIFGIVVFILSIVVLIIFGSLELPGVGAVIFLLMNVIYAFAVFVPSFAAGVRRLHDIDKSGWLMVLAFVPLASIVLLILLFVEGTPGPNQFGADPTGRA